MIQWLRDATDLLGASVYLPHSICLSNDPLVLALYVWADLAVFLSYMIIGTCLLFRRHVIFSLSTEDFGLFGAFIILCGCSHLTKTLTLYWGVYRLDIFIMALTAGVSSATAAITLRKTIFHRGATWIKVS